MPSGPAPGRPRANWAGNVAFRAPDFHRPASIRELQAVVARSGRIRALGTGHSFTDLADSPGAQVTVAGLPPEVSVDSAASRVRVSAGLTYAELARPLARHGLALASLASLPHISVAGACATATHGSGMAQPCLAAAVAGLTLVTAGGDLLELTRPDPGFAGAVVHLGALGVVTSLTLDVVPAFDVAQRVYEDLPLDALDDHFTALMAAGYSVSLFTDWRAPRLTQLWIKQRLGPRPPGQAASTPPPASPGSLLPSPVTREPWFTAQPALSPRHPVRGASPDACTGQLGRPGPWFERLPHFRPGFTPSAGQELQSEYLLPVARAVPALHALSQIRDQLAPVLQVSEIRVVAADDLWLSPAYRQDSVALHFTWIADPAAVRPAVTLAERQLAPFAPRPHWGKVFTIPPADLSARYERLPDFVRLARRLDPEGKFSNAFTARYLAV